MIKFDVKDVIALLRKFKQADDNDGRREVSFINVTAPELHSTLIGFRFKKQQFYALLDETVEDNQARVEQAIAGTYGDVHGELLRNPKDDSLYTYGMPYKGKEMYLYKVTPTSKRLDSYLAEVYPERSRSAWQKHVRAGHVKLNGEICLSVKAEVSLNDQVSMEIPSAEIHSDKVLPILYIDDDIIVVNKPSGVLTHAKGGIVNEFTVADFFSRYTKGNFASNKAGIVHRLDRDTSGVIIGARTPEVYSMLQQQFANRSVKKEYVAVVQGHPSRQSAIIDIPIGRNPKAPSTFKPDTNGKAAQTSYKVTQTSDTRSLVTLQPKTGRTHQLRVHLKHIGTPIVGDRVYGTPDERLYLHAHMLTITHPNGETMTFTSPVPSTFNAAL
ncbi:RluA family pseudouridine synthase [Candidatus Saccharibacteria bacterium]|nr:RluA family pseudouridine synthase [Candidatus Saccharibacteria bacterium]